MPEDHVEEYVRENLRRGYTADSIKEMLRVSGSDPSIVDKIISENSSGSSSEFQISTSTNAPKSNASADQNPNSILQGNIASVFQKMSFIEKVKMVLINPKGFFDIMPQTGGYGEPFKFAILNIFIAVILSTILATISKGIDGGIVSVIILSIAIFISLIYLPIVLFIGSGINHLFLKLFRAKNNYEATFRVVSYITPFQILSSISSLKIPGIELIGILISLYMLYALVIGYSKVHDITKLRALVAILMPGMILLGIGIVIALILTQFGAIPYFPDQFNAGSSNHVSGRCLEDAIGFPTGNALTPDGEEYSFNPDGSADINVKNNMGQAVTLRKFTADGIYVTDIGQTINPGKWYNVHIVPGILNGGKSGTCYNITVTLTYDVSGGLANEKSTGQLRGKY